MTAALCAHLEQLRERAGARSIRVVDGRSGTVVARVGVACDVAALTRFARDAAPSAMCDGGEGGLVLSTRSALHVLCESSVAGVFLHAQFDVGRGADEAVRRALAEPALLVLVREAVEDARTVVPGPEREPALSWLGSSGPPAARSPTGHAGREGPPAMVPLPRPGR